MGERGVSMRKFGVVAGICGFLALFVVVPASSAGRPSGFTCNPDGTVCQFSFSSPYGPTDTGFVCGSGSGSFDIFDQGLETDKGTLWSDQNGNVTKIFEQVTITGGMWSNPLTGAVVPYTQHNTETFVLAVPGDFSTVTETITGENIYRTSSGTGKFVFLAPGRQVFDPSGGLISTTPNNGFMEAIFGGDAHAFDQVCATLGA
jgi:hypothetical protein